MPKRQRSSSCDSLVVHNGHEMSNTKDSNPLPMSMERWTTQLAMDYHIFQQKLYGNNKPAFRMFFQEQQNEEDEAVCEEVREAFRNMIFVAYIATESDARNHREPKWQKLWFGPWRPAFEHTPKFKQTINKWKKRTDQQYPQRQYVEFLRDRAFGLVGSKENRYVVNWKAPFWEYYKDIQQSNITGQVMEEDELHAERARDQDKGIMDLDEGVPLETSADFQWDEAVYGSQRSARGARKEENHNRRRRSDAQSPDDALVAKFEAELIRAMEEPSSDDDQEDETEVAGHLSELSLAQRPIATPARQLKRKSESTPEYVGRDEAIVMKRFQGLTLEDKPKEERATKRIKIEETEL